MAERTIRKITQSGAEIEQVAEAQLSPLAVFDPGWPQFLREYYQEAWDVYHTFPMPSVHEDAWRRTDLRNLKWANMAFDAGETATQPIPRALLRPLISKQHAGQLVLTSKEVQGGLDADLRKKGVIFSDLMSAVREHPAIVEKVLGQVVHSKEGKFAALAALARGGVIVYLPRGVQLEQPLHSLLWGADPNRIRISHLVIYLEEGSSLTYLHESASPHINGQSVHTGMVEIFVEERASLRFVELQSWGDSVWNFSHERAHLEADANLDWIFGALGSRLTKNFSEIDLVGSGANARMSGFYFTNGNQHLDHDTQQNHLAPHTTSDLLFKGALKGASRSVWQGMIYVAPGAQKTDGYQANRNLILSPDARADSIPGLEIMADDVRCTHGSTVGKIDAEQLFFLQSRGITKEDAERLIVEGFFDPIMQRIPYNGVRNRFKGAIEQKMKRTVK